MKKENLIKSSFIWKMAFILTMLLVPAALVNAQVCQTVTFAQFTQKTGSQDFVFTNSNPVSSFATVQGGSAINFSYFNIAGLPAELSGTQNARVFFNCTTSALGFVNVGRTVQPFNNTCTIQIIRDFPASVGVNTRTNLLSVTVVNEPTTSDLSGDTGSNSAGYSASTPNQMVTFTSDFLAFGASQSRNLALGFSSINPNFSINNINGFLNSFSAAGTGTFASCPAPTFMPPTAAAASIGGRVLSSNGRGLGRAVVTLTTASGETFTTITNGFGYYRFEDVFPGQTVILNVTSKRFEFAPKVLNIGEDLYELDFMPQQ